MLPHDRKGTSVHSAPHLQAHQLIPKTITDLSHNVHIRWPHQQNAAAIAAQHSGAVGAWAPDRKIVDAQSEAEYGDKPWWQKGILACMAPRRPV